MHCGNMEFFEPDCVPPKFLQKQHTCPPWRENLIHRRNHPRSDLSPFVQLNGNVLGCGCNEYFCFVPGGRPEFWACIVRKPVGLCGYSDEIGVQFSVSIQVMETTDGIRTHWKLWDSYVQRACLIHRKYAMGPHFAHL